MVVEYVVLAPYVLSLKINITRHDVVLWLLDANADGGGDGSGAGLQSISKKRLVYDSDRAKGKKRYRCLRSCLSLSYLLTIVD